MTAVNRIRWRDASPETRQRIMGRAGRDVAIQEDVVAAICREVKERGDPALLEYTERFDGIALSAGQMAVTEEDFLEARNQVDQRTLHILQYAAGNIRRFHEAQKPAPMWMMDIDEGIMAGEKVTPIPDVALYVPRGKGSFPSVLLMLGTPAVVAGVPRIVVLTPPNEQGGVDPAILCVADLLGIREVYKVGGAQAVAAAAYGTATIPKCSKIIGPGNPYVSAAKRLLARDIDPGVPAGPSEAVILADEWANPEKAALDLLIEAEHGPDSAALLVTHSIPLADKVIARVQSLVAEIVSDIRRRYVETVLQQYGGVIITEDIESSLAFVNEYAPEHMEVMVRDPFAVLPKIRHAGEILLGEHTPITLCNFLLGPNAILPTGRQARTVSAVSLWDFLKRSSIGYVTEEGFAKVRDMAAEFADLEGFETHATALRSRPPSEQK
ncbi:MAG: histidinol dehydrogenase [Bacilli bacterium]